MTYAAPFLQCERQQVPQRMSATRPRAKPSDPPLAAEREEEIILDVMTEAERKSFFNYTSSRAPGKRQIKPTAAVLDMVLPNADDEDDDEDFIAEHDNGSTECSDSESGGSDDDSSSSSEEDEEEEESGETNNEACGEKSSIRALICAVCLSLTRNEKSEELMQCDKCGLTVHDSCYPTLDVTEDNDSTDSSSSMEPWFCEPCIYGFQEPPYCELCPSRYGAMKRSDVGGRWVHLICALYTRGVTFGDIDHLSAVSWQEMDHRIFGRKSCNGCTDILEARSGVVTRCEVGLCKLYYHVTCAQRAANFIVQEQSRLFMVGKKVLSEREERKRLRAKEKYEKLFQSLLGVTICLPEAFHDKADKKTKRARHLTSSPEFFEWFQEKAELSGIEPVHFRQEFTKVSGDFITFLTPGFSAQFFEYVENRERIVIATEERKLQSIKDSKMSLKQQLESQTTKLKLNEQSGLLGRERSERRKQLANAFHAALVKLGARKIFDINPIFVQYCDSPVNGKARNSLVKNSPMDASDSPPKLVKEITINMCKECGKSHDQHLIIGCDSCYEYYHIGCLDPPLEKVPKKVNCEWHCAQCCESDDEERQREENKFGRSDSALSFTSFCFDVSYFFHDLGRFGVIPHCKAREQHNLKELYISRMQALERDLLGQVPESVFQQELSNHGTAFLLSYGVNIWPSDSHEASPTFVHWRQQPVRITSSPKYDVGVRNSFSHERNMAVAERCEVRCGEIEPVVSLHEERERRAKCSTS
uniref:PHD finger protein 14 n=1 Tax=Angiostrongylus cantonensis TaxID=6313 RepID=A0A158PAS5_ANGCA